MVVDRLEHALVSLNMGVDWTWLLTALNMVDERLKLVDMVEHGC